MPADVPVDRRSLLRAGSAVGVTSILLPSAVAAASVFASPTYTTVTDGGTVFGWGRLAGSGVFGSSVSGNLIRPRLLTGGTVEYEAAEIVKAYPIYWASAGLASDGSIYTWGNATTYSSPGRTTSTSSATRLSDWLDEDGSTSITAPVLIDFCPSQTAVVAVGDDGHIYAWGQQWGSEAGLPSNFVSYAPPRRVTAKLGLTGTVSTSQRIVQVSGNNRLMVWLDGEGRVRTSGSTTFAGQLGRSIDATPGSEAGLVGGSIAATVGTADRIVQVAAGYGFALALGRDGSVHAWGSNGSGQLGDGTTTTATEPAVINGTSGTALPAANSAGRIIQVSAGNGFALALGLDGRLYAWGGAADGRLGNGTTSPNVLLPVEITGNGDLPSAGAANAIVQIAAGHKSAYALGSDGSVYSWGYGGTGDLGNGGTASTSSPVRIWDQGALANLAPYNTGTQTRIVFLGVHRGADDSSHVLAVDNSSSTS